jgi:hypothetical protein
MHIWFRRCSTLAALALATVSLTATPASAQKAATVGFLGGADFTTFKKSDLSVRASTGFAGGFWLGIPVAKSLEVEPELLYSNKGYGLKGTDTRVNLNYIEVPVLLRYAFTPDGGPFAFAGPYVGIKVKCNTVVDTLPVPCEDDGIQTNTVVGGAVGVGYRKEAFGFDVRYEYDFGDAIKQLKGRNNAVMVLVRVAVN